MSNPGDRIIDPDTHEDGYMPGEFVGPYEFLDMVSDIWALGFVGPIVDAIEDWDDLRPYACDWYARQEPREWHNEAGRNMAHDFLAYEENYRKSQYEAIFGGEE